MRLAGAGIEKTTITALLFAVMGLTAADLYSDRASGISLRHVITELIVIAAAAVGIVSLWWRAVLEFQTRMRGSEADLAKVREEAAHWEREAGHWLQGLSTAIDEQFARWQLTESERDVARLLLKGLSLKEVADVRGVSERTVRHQSLSIYRKSGLGGRADLAAFFLEDLLLPSRSRSGAVPS